MVALHLVLAVVSLQTLELSLQRHSLMRKHWLVRERVGSMQTSTVDLGRLVEVLLRVLLVLHEGQELYFSQLLRIDRAPVILRCEACRHDREGVLRQV